MNRTAAIILIIIAIAAGAIAGGVRLASRSTAVYTDGDTIRVPAASAPLREILWQPAAPLPLPVRSENDEYEPSLSADGASLYFVRGRAGENADIYVCTRTPQGWSEPRALAAINSGHDDLGPAPSADGRALYFYSDRPGGEGGYDLWVSHRVNEDWGEPINLAAGVNTSFNEYGPAVTPDGRALYFASNRPRPGDASRDLEAWPATLREQRQRNDYDLYLAAVDGEVFGPPASVTSLNTPHNEGSPAVSPFGDFLYFASDRPSGTGGFDLYRARRLRGGHTGAESLGLAINSHANELDPALSMGGYAIHFSSNRGDSGAGAELARTYDIYSSTSREVFREQSPVLANIDWGTLTPLLWWLLLALLLLLLLLSLPRAARSRRFRQLSLLAKCLLLSLLLHMLILMGLTLWRVGVGLDRFLKQSGGGVIAVTLPSAGDEITEQLRAGAGEAPIPSMEVLETSRMEADLPTRDEPLPMPPREQPTPLEVELAAAPGLKASDAAPPTLRISDRPLRTPDSMSIALEAPMPPVALAAAEPVPPRLTDQRTSLPASARADISIESEAVRPATNGPALPAPSPSSTLLATTAPRFEAQDVAPERTAARPMPTSDVLPAPETRAAQSIAMPEASAGTSTVEPTASVQEPTLSVTRAAESVDGHPIVPADETSPPPKPMHVELPARPVLTVAADLSTPPTSPTAHGSAGPSLPALSSLVTPAGPASGPPPAAAAEREATEPVLEQNAPLLPKVARSARELPDASGAEQNEPAPAPSPVSASASQASPLGRLRPADAVPSRARAAQRGRSLEPQHDTALAFLPTPNLPTRAETRVSSEPVSPPAVASAARAMDSDVRTGRPSLPNLAASDLPSLPNHAGVAVRPSPPSPHFDSRSRPADAASSLADTGAPRRSPTTTDEPLPALESAFALPTSPSPRTDAYSQRAPEVRAALVERLGGSEETEEAVASALRWLAAHQGADGSWSSSGFDDDCGRCGGTSRIKSDVALTGLSLLCFLGADHTHLKDGPYQGHVARALRWLVSRQSVSGDLRSGETMYSHGIAAIALSEAYGMTGDDSLRTPVELATRFIVGARNRRAGGWRYDPGQAGDTSVLGWMVLAMASAKRSGIEVPDAALAAAGDWLDRVSWPQRPGVYAYQPGLPFTPSMTAEGLFVQQLLGKGGDSPATAGSLAYIAEHPPSWERDASTYYWYYATLALFQNQGEPWERWNTALKRELLSNQRRHGPAAGSWDPKDRYSMVGGRVYQTAICTLSLEVYYRYLPMYGGPARER